MVQFLNFATLDHYFKSAPAWMTQLNFLTESSSLFTMGDLVVVESHRSFLCERMISDEARTNLARLGSTSSSAGSVWERRGLTSCHPADDSLSLQFAGSPLGRQKSLFYYSWVKKTVAAAAHLKKLFCHRRVGGSSATAKFIQSTADFTRFFWPRAAWGMRRGFAGTVPAGGSWHPCFRGGSERLPTPHSLHL